MTKFKSEKRLKMGKIKRDIKQLDILLRDGPKLSYGTKGNKSTHSKKPIRRIAEPHLQSRVVNGKVYYYYRRGDDPMIHLGTADAILSAIKTDRALKEIRKSNRAKYATQNKRGSI